MAFVQSASSGSAHNANVSSYSLAFSTANAATNCLIVDVIFQTNHGSGSIAISDTQGNTYSTIVSGENGTTGLFAAMYTAPNIAAGSNTVTVTYTGSDSIHDIGLAIHEYSNVLVSPFDSSGYATFTTAASVTASVTTTHSIDTLHAFACNRPAASTFYPTGWSLRENLGTYCALASIDQSVSQAGTYSVSFSDFALTRPPFVAIVIGLKNITSPLSPGTAWLYINEPGAAGLTDRSSYLHFEEGSQHTFTNTLRNRGTADIPLIVRSGDSYMTNPDNYIGVQMFLYDQTPAGSKLVFAGTVDKIEVTWIDNSGDREIIAHLVSFDQCFDALLIPPQAFFYEKSEDIFSSLLGSVANGVPVVPGVINAPFVINSLTCDWDRLSDIFGQIATAATCIWGINLDDLSVYLKPVDTTASPYTLQSSQVKFGSVKWSSDRKDYRNRQIVRISLDAFAQSAEIFPLYGFPQSFELMRPAEEVTYAWFTRNTCNSATGTFTGSNPANGDTATIGYPSTGSIYNWAAAAPYAVGQIIIDPSNHVQKCTVAGYSGNTQPSWNDTAGVTSDGPGTPNPNGLGGVIWQDLGVSGAGGLGASVYTFVESLDNTQWGQVLIGTQPDQTMQNFADAINANQDTAGQAFSWSTWENPVVSAPAVIGYSNTITVTAKTPGSGYNASLSASSSAFAWSSSVTSGGTTEFGTVSLQVAANGSSNSANIYYTPGSNVVAIASAPAGVPGSGGYIQIQYKRYAGDCIICEDTAAVMLRAAAENGTGKYQQLVSDTTNTSNSLGLQKCQSTLAAFGTTPISFQFHAWKPGLEVGQLLSISLSSGEPSGLNSLINGNWIVQEITGELIPTRPYVSQSVVSGGGHYEYTVTVINVNQIFSYLEFWQGLGGGNSAGSGSLTAGSTNDSVSVGSGVRTILLRDTTIANHATDDVTVYSTGTATRLVGVLRDAITADLTIQIVKNGTTIMTATIPHTTAVDTPITFTSFSSTAFTDGDVLSVNITASDGLIDYRGVAAYTLQWS